MIFQRRQKLQTVLLKFVALKCIMGSVWYVNIFGTKEKKN